jgi:D-3-phosphoglycerate dehydrogenase
MLVVRHQDRPGVLAYVLNENKAANINVQRMENIIFAGAEAAVARIELDGALEPETMYRIRDGNNNIVEATLISLI